MISFDYVSNCFYNKEGLDLDIIGEGKTRVCLEIPYSRSDFWVKEGVCLKVPKCRSGLFQNRQEIHNWQSLDEISEFLLPILGFDRSEGMWILMPRGRELESRELFNDLKSSLDDFDWIKSSDLKIENCVLYGGDVYISDYGRLHSLV
jgi:hypothetical protein